MLSAVRQEARIKNQELRTKRQEARSKNQESRIKNQDVPRCEMGRLLRRGDSQ